MKYLPVIVPPEIMCPECGTMMPPLAGSRVVIAWYICPSCQKQWAARMLPGGIPGDVVAVDRSIVDKAAAPGDERPASKDSVPRG